MKIASPFVVVENCKEEIEFYQSILGGEIQILRKQDDKVLNANLLFGSTKINFADAFAAKPSMKGDYVKVILEIETEEEFRRALQLRYDYFQGYFFRRPEIMKTHDMPANQMNFLRMLQAVSRPELNFDELEKLVKAEAAVAYRLLRYLNSPMFSFQNEIHSVRHGLSILGERDIRRWVRLVAAVSAAQGRPSDLLLAALVRGRFGELLTPLVQHGESDLFLLGLLSLIDAMLEMPMTEVLEKIPLDHATKAVLLGEPSELGPVFQLMLAHESAEWEAAGELSARLHLDSEQVAADYWQAQQWAREVSSGV